MKTLLNLIFSILKKVLEKNSEIKSTTWSVKTKRRVLTVEDVLTSSGKYPERATHPEVTDEVRENIRILLESVNPLLEDMGIDDPSISSGFRTVAVNASLANSAKKSLHCQGLAVDLEDVDRTKAKAIFNSPHLLSKYELWLEHPDFTEGWVHLDKSTLRAARALRVFKP